jgi:two-component system cell cycle response regulator DivK
MKRLKILVVEDEPDALRVLTIRLKAHDYEVVTAVDAMQATARIRKEYLDLVILDIHLPAGGGFKVLERLRACPKTKAMPVIAITADPSNETKRRCYEFNCHAYFRKPYHPQRLLEAIELALGPTKEKVSTRTHAAA